MQGGHIAVEAGALGSQHMVNVLMLSLEPYELSYMQITRYFSRGIIHT